MHEHYATLDVDAKATEEEIRAAYRCAVRRCHPDLHPNDRRAMATFLLVQRAFEVLNDPDRREAYDRDLASPPKPPPMRPVRVRKRPYVAPARHSIIFQRTASFRRPSTASVPVDEDAAIQAVKIGTWACLALTYVGLAALYLSTFIDLGG